MQILTKENDLTNQLSSYLKNGYFVFLTFDITRYYHKILLLWIHKILNGLSASFRDLDVKRNLLFYFSERWDFKMDLNFIANTDVDAYIGL